MEISQRITFSKNLFKGQILGSKFVHERILYVNLAVCASVHITHNSALGCLEKLGHFLKLMFKCTFRFLKLKRGLKHS